MKRIIFLCLMALLTFSANAQIRVTPTGNDSNDGSDWGDNKAKKTVAAAITAAKSATTKEVWVKAGTYTEVWGTAFQESNIGGVNIYGSFEGGENTLAERTAKKVINGKPWEYLNPTVITCTSSIFVQSGDITTPMIIDGFSFKDGTNTPSTVNAAASFLSVKNNTTIQNCVFENNTHSPTATGNYDFITVNPAAAGESKVLNCLFKNNKYVRRLLECNAASAKVTVDGCVFTGNEIYNSYVGGNIVSGYGAQKTYVNNCVIYNNQVKEYVVNLGAASEMVNSLVYNNTSLNHGIVILLAGSKVVNSTIVNNASHDKGGVYINHTTTTKSIIDNSIIMNNKKWGTTDVSAITVSDQTTSYGEVRNCFFSGNGGKITKVAALTTEAANVTQNNNNTTKDITSVGFIAPTDTVGYKLTKATVFAAADFGLQNTSSLIDAGDNGLLPSGITLDLADTKRIKGTTIDVGAYEGLALNPFTWTQTPSSVTVGNTLELNAPTTVNTVVYSSGDLTKATVSGSTLTAVADGTVTITATPTVIDATEYQAPEPATATQDITIIAAGVTYDLALTANPTEGGTVSGGGTGLAAGATLITATANPGYRFEGWYNGDTRLSTDVSYNYDLTADATLTAKFVQVYTLSIVASNGNITFSPIGGSYAAGDIISVTANANDGYKFVSWTDGTTTVNTSPANYTMPAANTTLTATFMPTYTLTLGKGTGCATVTGGGTYRAGETVTLTATGNAGTGFENWTDGSGAVVSTTNPFSYTTTGAAVTLTANYITVSTIFVKTDGNDANNGYTWATAKKTVAAAVIAASSGVAVWVKAGTYDITASIDAKAGVSIYGGFAGTESAIAERVKGKQTWDYVNETVLIPHALVFNAVTAFTVAQAVIIDGFTLKDGNTANVVAHRDNTTLQNCKFINNTTSSQMVGTYVTSTNGPAKTLKCYFSGNTSATQIVNANPTSGYSIIDSCVFVGNVSTGQQIVAAGTNTIVSNSTFYNNKPLSYVVQLGGTARLVNSLIYNNDCTAHGVVRADATGAMVLNSTIVNNKTSAAKGGIWTEQVGTALKIYNTVVVGNTTKGITGGSATIKGTVANCAFDGALATTLTGANNITLADVAAAKFILPTNFVGQDLTKSEELPSISDFGLDASSPLFNKGKDTCFTAANYLTDTKFGGYYGTLYNKDLEGNTRYTGSNISIGAIEPKASLLDNPITWEQTLELDMNTKPSMELNATALSGVSVEYLSTNTQIATINGNILQAVSPGTTEITVYGKRTSTHKRATPVTLPLTITGDQSTLTITPNSLNLEKTATEGTLTLTSNYSAQMLAKPDWVTVVPTTVTQAEAATGKTITITPTANPTINIREGILVFVSGGKNDTVKIIQAEGDPTLVVSTTPATNPVAVTLLGAEGAAASVNVKSNTTWKITGDLTASGITIAPTSGTGDGAVTITSTQDNESLRTLNFIIEVVGHTANVPAPVAVTLTQSAYVPTATLFVDGTIAASGDGSDWSSAYQTISEAIDAASAGTNIYVKAGTYQLTDTLTVKYGIRLYGGFAGTERKFTERAKGVEAWSFTNVTIIKPALDKPVIDNVSKKPVTTPMLFDGFTVDGATNSAFKLKPSVFVYNSIIKNGYANTSGVGVVMGADARVWNSLIENNKVWLDSLSTRVYYIPEGVCTQDNYKDFHATKQNQGAGIMLTLPSSGSTGYTPLKGNLIKDNFGGEGGGIRLGGGIGYTGTVQITDCILENNKSIGFVLAGTGTTQPGNSGGGGLHINNDGSSVVLFENCLFKGNEKIVPGSGEEPGTPGGGAVRVAGNSGMKIFNRCTFTENASSSGLIISVNNANFNTHIINSLFYKNKKGTLIEGRVGVNVVNNTMIDNNDIPIAFNAGVVMNNISMRNGEHAFEPPKDGNVNEVTFKNVENYADLRLALLSPGVDKGVTITPQKTYGLTLQIAELLQKDFTGTSRPQGSEFDPGAFEYVKEPIDNITINWNQDLSNLNIDDESIILTAEVQGATPEQEPYVLPMKYISGDELTVSIEGSSLAFMGAGTTTVTAQTNDNPYYLTKEVQKSVTVTGENYLAVTPKTLSVGMEVQADVASFKLNTDKSWTISNVPSWLSLDKVLGDAGRHEVKVSVTEDNSLSVPRSATLTITSSTGKERTVVISQDGLLFSVSPTELAFSAIGEEKTFDVAANLTWLIDDSQVSEWVTVTPLSGTENATIYLMALENSATEQRTGVLTIYADRNGVEPIPVTIVQAAKKVPPTSVDKSSVVIVVYPNPVQNTMTLSLSEKVSHGTLKLFNSVGVKVYDKSFEGSRQVIDVAHLPQGIYMLTVTNDAGEDVQMKIIKQ